EQVITQVIVELDETGKDRSLSVDNRYALKAQRNCPTGCGHRDNGTFVDVQQPVSYDAACCIHGNDLPAQDYLRSFRGIDDGLWFGSLSSSFLFAHRKPLHAGRDAFGIVTVIVTRFRAAEAPVRVAQFLAPRIHAGSPAGMFCSGISHSA